MENKIKIEFRKASENDVSKIKQMARSVIKSNYTPFLGQKNTDYFIDSGASDKEIDDGLENCTIMCQKNEIVGFAIFDKNFLHIIMIAYEYQRQGFGGKLLKYVELELFKNNSIIHLQTFEKNTKTIKFYIDNGWCIVSKERIEELDCTMIKFEKTILK